jgi:hypothetical protein
MSARRLLSLVLNLPHRSRTMRAAEPDLWPVEETLLGLIVERLDALAVLTVRAAGGRAKKPGEIVPRPKKRRLRPKAVPAADVLAKLDGALAGGAV